MSMQGFNLSDPADYRQVVAKLFLANFGGIERLARLTEMLRRIESAGAVLFIVSFNFGDVIIRYLHELGLDPYFPRERVFARDSPLLHSVGYNKADLIRMIMDAEDWSPEQCLFVDDSLYNIV